MESTRTAGIFLSMALLVLAGAAPARAETPPETAAPVKSYLFSFWVGKRLEGVVQGEDATEARRIDSRVRDVGEGSCGAQILARVGRIPSEGDGYLVPDMVQELGDDHRVTRTWVIPIEYWPVAIDGDRVLVQGTASPAADQYWIGLDRRIQQDDQAVEGDAKPEACPAAAAAKLPESAYRRCVVLKDRKNGTSHRLAYEGVCT